MIHPYKKCPHCGEEFENIEGRTFSNHVRWCEKNPTNYRSKEKIENFSKATSKTWDDKLGPMENFVVKCDCCSKEFEVTERKNKFPMKEKYFCSRSCANTRTVSEDTKKKTSITLNKHFEENEKKGLLKNIPIKTVEKVCKHCGVKFQTRKRNQKYCSKQCGVDSRKRKDNSLTAYRQHASFKFSLNEFPEEFDFDLIEKYGWYSAANRGNNLDGVSRDHIISVKYGFENDIDPDIIAHPANCRLIRQRDNSSKHDKCDMTLDELKEKIELWDIKYNWV